MDGKEKTIVDTGKDADQEMVNTSLQTMHANTQRHRRSTNQNSDSGINRLDRPGRMGTSGARNRAKFTGRTRPIPVVTRKLDRPRKTMRITMKK
jgi:hypothetical protein